MPNVPTGTGDDERLRLKYGILAVSLGLGAILVAVLIVLLCDPNGGPYLGTVISPIAAVTGAYFGIQVSSSAAKDAQVRAANAEAAKENAMSDRATALGALDPQTAKELSPRLHFQP